MSNYSSSLDKETIEDRYIDRGPNREGERESRMSGKVRRERERDWVGRGGKLRE